MNAKRVALWLVGEPGAGKTALARQLLDAPYGLVRDGRVKWTVGSRVCAAGHYTGGAFDGADTVPYDGARPCLEFWRDALAQKLITVFDGDRFSNSSALEFMRRAAPGHVLACVLLTCAAAGARRAARSADVQDPTWVRGRATKAHNFHRAFPGARLQLESDAEPATLANRVKVWLATL